MTKQNFIQQYVLERVNKERITFDILIEAGNIYNNIENICNEGEQDERF